MNRVRKETVATISRLYWKMGYHASKDDYRTLLNFISQLEADLAAEKATVEQLERELAWLPEWKCPDCGATTRARMADYDRAGEDMSGMNHAPLPPEESQ